MNKDVLQQYAAKMQRISRSFRIKYPLNESPWKQGTYNVPICVKGKPDTKQLVWYENPGCKWSLSGGCTMCNFSMNKNFDESRVYDNFTHLLNSLDSTLRYIHLGPGGSVFHNSELNAINRKKILNSLQRFTFLEDVGIECRASLLKENDIMAALADLPPWVKTLSIDFGLESSDPFIRSVLVNKGEGHKAIADAMQLIKDVNSKTEKSVVVDCYVLLKPMWLSESEAVQDAINSINWAYDHGAATVSVFISTIKTNTLCHFTHSFTDQPAPFRYETPYLYSVFDVLHALTPERRQRTLVLGITSGMPLIVGPRSCELCEGILNGTITAHNYTRMEALLHQVNKIRCACRDNWEAEMSHQHDIHQHIEEYLHKLQYLVDNV